MPRENYIQKPRPAPPPMQKAPHKPPVKSTVSHRNLVIVAVVTAIIAFLLGMVQIMLTSQSMANAKRLGTLEKQINEALNVRDDLKVKLLQSENIMRVEQEAKDLGMIKLKPAQLKEIVVRLPKQAVEIPPYIEEQSWLQRFLALWR